jgi:demethylmenaquinone methyltransferase/2-methoxy-6-polyprenyl-1,4-benzoquinol methylase
MRHSEPIYYADRAREYELIYSKPERQCDLLRLREDVQVPFSGLSVLEIACGTGYWTQYIARTARSICATDLAKETLAVAREKKLASTVTFALADAMALPSTLGVFEAGFCGFWWSHVPCTALDVFLTSLHARLVPGATVVMLDNLYVAGSSTPISRRSATGDTYQVRHLSNGSTYEVLKNFPSEGELREQLSSYATDIKYTAYQHYWLLEYRRAA